MYISCARVGRPVHDAFGVAGAHYGGVNRVKDVIDTFRDGLAMIVAVIMAPVTLFGSRLNLLLILFFSFICLPKVPLNLHSRVDRRSILPRSSRPLTLVFVESPQV